VDRQRGGGELARIGGGAAGGGAAGGGETRTSGGAETGVGRLTG